MRSLVFLAIALGLCCSSAEAQLGSRLRGRQNIFQQTNSNCPGGVCPVPQVAHAERAVTHGPIVTAAQFVVPGGPDPRDIELHNSLHGGGNWTWPGGTAQSLKDHLATKHGVASRGTYPRVGYGSSGSKSSYGSSGSKMNYGSTGSKVNYGSFGSYPLGYTGPRVGDRYNGGVVVAVVEKPAPPVMQVAQESSVPPTIAPTDHGCPCGPNCTCGPDCDCGTSKKQLLVRKEDFEPCPQL